MKYKIKNVMLTASAIACIFFSYPQKSANSQESMLGGSSLEDSKNGVVVLDRMFRYINIYRQNHEGNYPSKDNPLLSDLFRNHKEYGFDSSEDASLSLYNPDNAYSDYAFIRKNPKRRGVPATPVVRPNGHPLGGAKDKGTSDVLAFSSTYFHKGGIDVTQGLTRLNPVGFYMVLYDSGTVKNISYDEVFFVYDLDSRVDNLSYGFAFPNQSGIPHNTLSYSEYQFIVGNRAGRTQSFPPIGYRVGKKNGNPQPDNGESEGVLNLLRQWQPNVERSHIWAALEKFGVENSRLSNLTSVTAQLGLNTQVQKLNLKDIQQKGVPTLIFLPDDGRIVTLLVVDADFAVIIDRGRTSLTEISNLQERLGSPQFEALVPTKALTQNAAIVADDAVRELKLPSLDAEVPQQFVLRNTGATPITLQLEYPLLGVTESKLSKDVIAPGETATLDIKVKWRSILKAPYQNVLVSIQTNDPIVPRLQLAVLLTPPQGAGK